MKFEKIFKYNIKIILINIQNLQLRVLISYSSIGKHLHDSLIIPDFVVTENLRAAVIILDTFKGLILSAAIPRI